MLAALSGCQKEEEIFDNSRFYAYSTPISPFTATVVSYLQKQDDSTHLSVAISKRYGFPVWNKAQYVKSGNKVLLFVPLAKNEEKSVGGVWYFTQEGNSISYRVLGNNPSQAGFDQYFWMIDYFNQVLFANSVYQYKSPKTNGYLKTEASDGLFITRCVDTFINDYFTGTHCWDVFNDGNGDGSLGATDLSGNGDNFTPPSGGSTNPADPNPEVDTKDPSFKDTKADCVFGKLVGRTATSIYDPNTVVGKLLKDFWGKESVTDITFKISDNFSSASKHANSQMKDNKIIVTLNQSYINSCSMVELARTLIHESIHAELSVKVAKLEGYFGKDMMLDKEFSDLWSKYKILKDLDQQQHNLMAENYINTIAKGVEAYHMNNRAEFEETRSTQIGEEWFNYDEFYKSIAWVGLDKTSQYTEKSKDTDWKTKYDRYRVRANSWDTKSCN